VKRRISIFLLSIPVGAAAGYFCSFVIVMECLTWPRVFSHHGEMNWMLAIQYSAFVAITMGAMLGGIVLPIAYLAILWRIPEGKVGRAIGWMFVWVLAPSLLISLAQQLAAFVGALASLFLSIFWITARYTCWLNHSTDPTLASGTAGAEHQARHP
jgi:hypothetical protein